MTKWKQLCFILSTKFLKLQTYLNCHFPNSCVYTHLIVNHLKTMITVFLVLASVHKCQTGFSLANISFTQNENASWLTFFKGHWFQDLVPRYFWRSCFVHFQSCFVHFQKQYPNDLLSCQKFCWFSFDMLSIICTSVLSTFWLLYILPLSCISVTSTVAHSTLSCIWACLCCVYLPYLTLFTCILVPFNDRASH